jgi:nicotinamidase-related amidase
MLNRLSTSLFAAITIMATGLFHNAGQAHGDDLILELRSQHRETGSDAWEIQTESEQWKAAATAVIVCDVWDKHHCLNAVRRLEEFSPRLNDVLKEARGRGATIIHADHPARKRAMSIPRDKATPADVEFWCSRIPAEEQAAYPIDQSDGGEDDDPVEHAKWAAELTALGRNPGMPWKTQSPDIEIDADHDFISDRGDEVWNILQSQGIENVILTGVHTNMCVLGRPFGLRQMVRNGKNVVLMRDMTDCMYNPKRWPFVDHFTGNDLIISHVERYVCPSITSDQILGGTVFRSKSDTRSFPSGIKSSTVDINQQTFRNQWTTAKIGAPWQSATNGRIEHQSGVVWLRCTVRLPKSWIADDGIKLQLPESKSEATAWINGVLLTHNESAEPQNLTLTPKSVVPDDINLLVIRTNTPSTSEHLYSAPVLISRQQKLPLEGRWQFRIGDDATWSNIPLPAKFGMGSDVLFEPR